MVEPALVGDCLAAMKAAVSVPVTVKCRIGIGCSDVRIFARFLQQACPRIFELRSPITMTGQAGTLGRMQGDWTDAVWSEQRSELGLADRPLSPKVRPLTRRAGGK
jgi:hypothetical protein